MPMSDQREIEDGDGAPVDVLASLFDARGWDYEFISDEEILGEIQGSWASYQLRAIWRTDFPAHPGSRSWMNHAFSAKRHASRKSGTP